MKPRYLLHQPKPAPVLDASHPALSPSYPFPTLLLTPDHFASDEAWDVVRHCDDGLVGSALLSFWPAREGAVVAAYAEHQGSEPIVVVIGAENVASFGALRPLVEDLFSLL